MMMTKSAGATHNARMNDTSQRLATAFFSRAAWRTLLPLGLALFLPCHALAWNSAGHRLIAAIAWENLEHSTRLEATRLLREHPDYARWHRRASADAEARTAFIEASTWPDQIRQDRRFYSAGTDQPTPTLPGYPDMERRRNWHYVNRPLADVTGKHPVSGQIDTQLVALAQTLGNPEASSLDRHYALPWLIHLTGDAHQPLHASIRLDADGHWDKLGNGMRVVNPFNPKKTSSTLHAFWDDLPGPSGLRGERLDVAMRALLAVYPRPPRSGTSQSWIEESWQIAGESGYPKGNEPVPTISEAFYANSREIANRRVTQAGHRLAALLNSLLGARQGRN